MWEQIRSNRRRSILLIGLMGLVLLALGFLIGASIAPEFGIHGLAGAAIVWSVLMVVAFSEGRRILLADAHARRIEHADAPQLFNVVEEMAIAAQLPSVPKVYIIDNDAPNAFAVGTPENSAIGVTTGILIRLNRDELQGVVAHEIGHIKNEDTKFMTYAGVMLASIVLIADVFVRINCSGSRRSRKAGQAQAVFVLLAVLFAILAPLFAHILYFACSRRREYLADASSARFTRYPEGLASALEKIGGGLGKMQHVSRATAPMYIVNPLRGARRTGVFSTHPPIEDRVRILRGMSGGADFGSYEKAYRSVQGGQIIGRRSLGECKLVGIRPPCAEPERPALEKTREAVDILHRMDGMLFLTCACGLRIKVSSEYEQDTIRCPKCDRETPIPKAITGAAAFAALGRVATKGMEQKTPGRRAVPAEPALFRHKPGSWQSFRCTCGHAIQLSPVFSAPKVRCRKCRRETDVQRI